VLNDFIAGQEVGNVPYVVDNGAGVFCDEPTKIATIVSGVVWAQGLGVCSDGSEGQGAGAAGCRVPDREGPGSPCVRGEARGVDQRELAYL